MAHQSFFVALLLCVSLTLNLAEAQFKKPAAKPVEAPKAAVPVQPEARLEVVPPAKPAPAKEATKVDAKTVALMQRDQAYGRQLIALNAKLPRNLSKRRCGTKPYTKTPDYKKQPWGYSLRVGKDAVPAITWYKGHFFVSSGVTNHLFSCFNVRTGRMLWSQNLGDNGASTGCISNDVCVVNTESCTIYALDAKSGKMYWSRFLGDPMIAAPMILGNRVYTSYYNKKALPANYGAATFRPTHVLACLDLRTGAEVWSSWLDGDIISAPVGVKGRVLATTFAGTHLQFDAANGKLLYTHRGALTSAPVVYGANELLVTRRRDYPVAQGQSATAEVLERFSQAGMQRLILKKQNATGYLAKAQKNQVVGPVKPQHDGLGMPGAGFYQMYQGSRPAVGDDGTIYSTMGNYVRAFDTQGKQIWEQYVTGESLMNSKNANRNYERKRFLMPPALAGNAVFVGTGDGRLLLFEKKTGKPLKSYLFPGTPVSSQVTVMEGTAIVPTETGVVHVVDLGDSSYTGWETWGGNMQFTNSQWKEK